MEPEDVALDTLTIVMYAGLGFLAGALASLLVTLTARLILRKRDRFDYVAKRLRAPQRVFLLVLGTCLGIYIRTTAVLGRPEPEWRPIFIQIFTIALIFAGAYLLTGVVRAVEDGLLRSKEAGEETPHFRRVRTQSQIIVRVAIAVIWICAFAGALLTFPQFRAVGASLFASAGVLSIVAGLAAQSTLSNVFAGMQIAFSDALRVGDLVVVESEMGNIEEITLTYVVVRTWDDRRWIVPSNYFTTKRFENWTRREPKLLGTVELDLDWLVPIEAMRIEVRRLVQASDLWDGRSVNLQVTDATGGHVRVRAVVSAASSGDLWDLRCYVREELINWVQHHAVYALPRTRLEPETTTAPPVEEREEFIEQMVTEWEEEQAVKEAEEQTALLEAVPEKPADEPPLPRSWLRALRDQRNALYRRSDHVFDDDWDIHDEEGRRRTAPTALPGPVLPSASSDPGAPPTDPEQTRVMSAIDASARSAEARLYSGSPEAEERKAKLSGPSAADMAERESTAERRLNIPTESPDSGSDD
ncbi:MAG TPA: mechanosensitive ion channel [Tessaracoccus flavescens]|uniref:Mechanosensitive ion channel n=1 Tax=Tessaracoccus flavescens TaxID=399497 RepID=A0A921EP58_9ACTN|nr:mechanosensitive ion channel [Tessaracoccus flavescens]